MPSESSSCCCCGVLRGVRRAAVLAALASSGFQFFTSAARGLEGVMTMGPGALVLVYFQTSQPPPPMHRRRMTSVSQTGMSRTGGWSAGLGGGGGVDGCAWVMVFLIVEYRVRLRLPWTR